MENDKMPNVDDKARRALSFLPVKIGNLAKNHYLAGFRKGGYQTDESLSGWKDRKRKDKSKKGKRALLVKSGDLRRDLDVRHTDNKKIVLGTNDTDYASYHNEGTKIHPKREFLGDSRELEGKIKKLITAEFDKAFKR